MASKVDIKKKGKGFLWRLDDEGMLLEWEPAEREVLRAARGLRLPLEQINPNFWNRGLPRKVEKSGTES